MFLQNGDNLSFYTMNVNSHTSGGPQGVVADNAFHLNDGEWHHIAAVRDEDAKEIRLYINGRLVGAEGERNRSLNRADGGRKHIWIGVHIPNHAEQTGTGFFPATVDEVRFWNIAMTQADAARYMTLSVGPLEKLPVRWGEIKAKWMEGD